MSALRPHPPEEGRAKHEELVAVYNSVGITSIFERATDRAGFAFFQEQSREGRLKVRERGTFRSSAKDAAGVKSYLSQLGIGPGEGDDMVMLDFAVNRIDGQRLSRLDALRTLTVWPAWLSFDEAALGSLEVGKLADFVVLDRDYLTCPCADIRKIRPHMTVMGGEVVFRAL